MTVKIDEHYTDPKLAEIYDYSSGWSEDREYYLNLIDHATSQTILDIGCGTGLLCDVFEKKGHTVTGADPASAMLSVAKNKNSQVSWVCTAAEDLNLNVEFDLIIMTGHAFQTLLSDEQILKTLHNIKRHLRPSGIAVFESRNPQINWAAKWNYKLQYQVKNSLITEQRKFLSIENEIMKFNLKYSFDSETYTVESTLRFASSDKIINFLDLAGLHVEKILGDWGGGLFDKQDSEEMIFILKK